MYVFQKNFIFENFHRVKLNINVYGCKNILWRLRKLNSQYIVMFWDKIEFVSDKIEVRQTIESIFERQVYVRVL